MRRRLRKASAPSYAGDGKDPKIAAWLLLTNTVGLGIDAQNQSLHLFTLKKPVESFPRADLRRIEARRKRTWLGRWRNALFISEDFGGPGRDLPVIDGDLAAFLRLAGPSRGVRASVR